MSRVEEAIERAADDGRRHTQQQRIPCSKPFIARAPGTGKVLPPLIVHLLRQRDHRRVVWQHHFQQPIALWQLAGGTRLDMYQRLQQGPGGAFCQVDHRPVAMMPAAMVHQPPAARQIGVVADTPENQAK